MSKSTPIRAVIYAAKSTEDKHGSIPAQLEDCLRMAHRECWEIVDEYSDENASAYHGDRGPGLAKARELAARVAAEQGGCILLAQHSDRLARGDGLQAQHLIEVVLWARKHGVTIRSVQDDSTAENLIMAVVMGERNTEDSRRKGLATQAGIRRRAERGHYTGSKAPYGYKKRDVHPVTGKPTGPLVFEPTQAPVLRRIFGESDHGVGERGIVKALDADRVPGPTGGRWHQSRISAILSNPVYMGLLPVKSDEGEWLKGTHEALIGVEQWERVRRRRESAHRRRGGRHADGAHLLTRSLLRCGECGSAMNPRKARPGVERERYVCSGRIADPTSCSQRSIERELIDEPLLTALLDRFVDLHGMRQRIAERMSSAVVEAREAADERERERARAEAALSRVRNDYQRGAIEAEDWREQRPALVEAVEAAFAAAERSRAHVEALAAAPAADPERELLDALARLKAAVATGVDAAPNRQALRNTLGDLFESIVLVRSDELPWDALSYAKGQMDQLGEPPELESKGKLYWLSLSFRRSAMDPSEALQPLPVEIPSPIGQDTPVEWFGQYPPGFLCRYCWW